MGRRGPKPKPTKLKELAGNPGKRRLNKSEPKPKALPPAKVAKVAKKRQDPLADGLTDFYARYGKKLRDLGVLTEVDEAAFDMMAVHWSLAREVAQIVRKDGVRVKDENGLDRKHPLLQVLRDNSAAFRQYAAEFGMTPSSRSALHVEPPAKEKTLAEMLFEGVDEPAVNGAANAAGKAERDAQRGGS
jgi:P27 family predicted phage terminase small subunit